MTRLCEVPKVYSVVTPAVQKKLSAQFFFYIIQQKIQDLLYNL